MISKSGFLDGNAAFVVSKLVSLFLSFLSVYIASGNPKQIGGRPTCCCCSGTSKIVREKSGGVEVSNYRKEAFFDFFALLSGRVGGGGEIV